ncbi:hypothetical protein A6R68_09302, partial [Neotoma lepida]
MAQRESGENNFYYGISFHKEPSFCRPAQNPERDSTSDNSSPTEAPTTVQEDNMTSLSTSQSLLGRDWHKPNPGLVKRAYESQESESVVLRDNLPRKLNSGDQCDIPVINSSLEFRSHTEEPWCWDLAWLEDKPQDQEDDMGAKVPMVVVNDGFQESRDGMKRPFSRNEKLSGRSGIREQGRMPKCLESKAHVGHDYAMDRELPLLKISTGF